MSPDRDDWAYAWDCWTAMRDALETPWRTTMGPKSAVLSGKACKFCLKWNYN
ncbi:MAG: hypothetical protein U0931_27495 [Vulcanimicrobiota bacterium]